MSNSKPDDEQRAVRLETARAQLQQAEQDLEDATANMEPAKVIESCKRAVAVQRQRVSRLISGK